MSRTKKLKSQKTTHAKNRAEKCNCTSKLVASEPESESAQAPHGAGGAGELREVPANHADGGQRQDDGAVARVQEAQDPRSGDSPGGFGPEMSVKFGGPWGFPPKKTGGTSLGLK